VTGCTSLRGLIFDYLSSHVGDYEDYFIVKCDAV
jgi:hypothetical protein